MAQAERIADGHDPITHSQVVGIAQGRCRERLWDVHLQHRQVGLGITPDDAGLVFTTVGQGHRNFISAFNNVVVGKDLPLGADNDTGPIAVLPEMARPPLARMTGASMPPPMMVMLVAEETAIEVFERAVFEPLGHVP